MVVQRPCVSELYILRVDNTLRKRFLTYVNPQAKYNGSVKCFSVHSKVIMHMETSISFISGLCFNIPPSKI